jgi:hypothetical protein
MLIEVRERIEDGVQPEPACDSTIVAARKGHQHTASSSYY